MTARIKRRQVVHGLINEYRGQRNEPRKRQFRASVRVLARHRLTAGQHETQRHSNKKAREAGYPQLTGYLRRWWQVLGSNQRRLSRRFYRGPIPAHRNAR